MILKIFLSWGFMILKIRVLLRVVKEQRVRIRVRSLESESGVTPESVCGVTPESTFRVWSHSGIRIWSMESFRSQSLEWFHAPIPGWLWLQLRSDSILHTPTLCSLKTWNRTLLVKIMRQKPHDKKVFKIMVQKSCFHFFYTVMFNPKYSRVSFNLNLFANPLEPILMLQTEHLVRFVISNNLIPIANSVFRGDVIKKSCYTKRSVT